MPAVRCLPGSWRRVGVALWVSELQVPPPRPMTGRKARPRRRLPCLKVGIVSQPLDVPSPELPTRQDESPGRGAVAGLLHGKPRVPGDEQLPGNPDFMDRRARAGGVRELAA